MYYLINHILYVVVSRIEAVMGESIAIKGNRYGLKVTIDPEVEFDRVLKDFTTKLDEGRKFFGNAKISVDFTGRELTEEETEKMIAAVHTYSDMKVFCVVDDSMAVIPPEAFKAEPVPPEIIKEVVTRSVIPMESAVFHQGTLRSGQELNVDTGIIVVGDVNPGAKIISKGNIFVIGQLKGFAHAGYGGEEKACIFALKMAPTQMRIGRVIARSPDKFDDEGISPQIAFLEDNRITIDRIDRTLYNSFELLK